MLVMASHGYQCAHCGQQLRSFCHSRADDFWTRVQATTLVCGNSHCPYFDQHYQYPLERISLKRREPM